jgi:CheY-like chemotaxis protein
MRPEQADGSIEPRSELIVDAGASRSRPARILIVDDDLVVTETFSRMLTLEGYDVHTAPDAETAMREVETNGPDAILLDLRMRVADGLTFLRRLRAREMQQRTAVAVITADYLLDPAITAEINDLGAAVHFKPLWLEDLLQITKQLLQSVR